MKRAHWVGLMLAGCASSWPKPQTHDEWNATVRACRDGNQAACYFKALGEERTQRRAMMKTACEAKVGIACNELGFSVGLEDGGARAMELWRQACELGSKDGCDSLGTGWRDGVGGTVDARAAVAAYELACKQHDAAGCTNLGRQLLSGEGAARDAARAERLWRVTCAEEEIYDSCRLLGVALARGEGLPRDVDAGVAFLQRACRYGKARDCLAASEVFQELKQPAESLRYLRTSCAWGSTSGCLALVKVLRAGEPDEEQLREARDAEVYACMHGGCDGGVDPE